MHSPFVFGLQQHVFDKKHHHYDFDWLSALREELEQDDQVLHIEDYGAGSTSGAGNQRSVKSIAGRSVKRTYHSRGEGERIWAGHGPGLGPGLGGG